MGRKPAATGWKPVLLRSALISLYRADGAKAKGAKLIVFSPVPRNIWRDGKVVRAVNDYGKWAAEMARAEGVPFLDLNELIDRRDERLGEEKVKSLFGGDHTHTNEEGAKLSASIIAEGLRTLADGKLAGYLKASP